MKRKSEPKVLLPRRTFASLILLVALPVACQNEKLNSNSGATTTSNQTANAELRHLPSVDSHTASQRTAVDVARTNQPDDANAKDSETGPKIKITEVPSKGAGSEPIESIAGTVGGVTVTECKVVVFAHTNTWYVQPWIDSYDTAIKNDRTWRTDTHLGSEYAALLVKSSYKAPATTGKLPDIGGLVLAIARVEARK